MKKYSSIILTIFVAGIMFKAYPQSYDQNFSHTKILRLALSDESELGSYSTGDITEIFKYYDGLGRSSQTVNKNGSPGMNDMVWFNIYDEYGRTPKQYLPFTVSKNHGEFMNDITTDQSDFYKNTLHIAHTNYPFSVTEYEDSPQQKISEQGSPGYWWQPDEGGHTLRFEYTFNQQNEVKKWYIDATTGNCVSTSSYPANELYVKIIKDQNWDGDNGGLVKEYRDKTGRLILKANRLDANTSLKTYYVYDQFNNLRFIITPEAMKEMDSQGTYNSSILTEELVYEFIYDEKRRVIEKRIPGMEPVYIVYDKSDRPILQQNGNLRADNKWEFIKYDLYGRPVMTGIFFENTLLTRQNIQNTVDNGSFPLFETFTGIASAPPHGYTNLAYPILDANSEILKVLYWDNYDFDASGTYDYTNFTDEFNNEPFYRIKGKLAGSKTAILGTNPVEYLFSVFYYDKKGRLIRGISDNHLNGIDYGDLKYLFSGEVHMANSYHNTIINSQSESNVIKWMYSYDHAGRLVTVRQGINTTPDQTILMNKYNELGQLIEKNVHQTTAGEYLQSVDYKYNISGMLKHINRSNLSNFSKVIDFDQELTADEIVYGIKYDSIYFSVEEVIGQQNNPDYLNLNIGDVKQILVCHENDTSQKRSISVNESQLYVLDKSMTDSLTYHKLKELHLQDFEFDYDSLAFDNNTMQSVIVESLVRETETQFYSNGISDTAVVEDALSYVSSFLNEGIGIIYFNEDPNDLFGMDLFYSEGFAALDGSEMFNGNISGIKWQEKYFEGERGYGYEYDNLYRLKTANYGEKETGTWETVNNSFGVNNISYDLNGNILSLVRRGLVEDRGQPEYGIIDDLTYTYDGNRLKSVDDNIGAPSLPANDFSDNGAYNSEEYFYDANGNMIKDDNKGILNIVYNYLNLPQEITLSGNKIIEYIYDASGNKLTQLVKLNGQLMEKTDYISGYIYKDEELESIMFGEGRAVKQTNGSFRNEYTLTDHLGNVRVMYSDTDDDGDADIIREHHYYPYGMKMGGLNFISSTENKFLYQGKELQTSHNLLWYDFGARYFDHQLGRWHSIDPALQFASPYVGMGNNPVVFTDPDGRSVGWPPDWLKAIINFFKPDACGDQKPYKDDGLIDSNDKGPGNYGDNGYYYSGGGGAPGIDYWGGYGDGSNNGGGGGGASGSGTSTSDAGSSGSGGSRWAGPSLEEQIVIAKKEIDGLVAANNISADEGTSSNYLLVKMYTHFQIGGGKPLIIDVSSLDFSNTNQRQLGLDKLEVGQTLDPVNLFKMGINSISLAFGRVKMTKVSETQFSIADNRFDWNYEQDASWQRNTGTILGGIINYNIPFYRISPLILLIPGTFGGSFKVIFNGPVYIPK